MTTVKITKRERYESIKALVEAVGAVEGIDTEGIVAFCDKEIAALATRAEKAKERAAEKRAEGDELQAAVLAALTDEPATRQDVFERIEGEDVTNAKVQYRLNALVKVSGGSMQTHSKFGDGRKEPLCARLALMGAPVSLLQTVMNSATLDGVIPLVRKAGYDAVWTDLCRAAAAYAAARVRGALRVDALMLDGQGGILGQWRDGGETS